MREEEREAIRETSERREKSEKKKREKKIAFLSVQCQ